MVELLSWQGAEDLIKPMVGGWGVFFSLGLNAALIYITMRAQKRAKTAEAWESTARAATSEAAAAKGEKDTWKEAAARVEKEKVSMATELGRLHAATDLTQLTRENQQEHRAIIEALNGVKQAVDNNTKTLLGFQTQNAGVFEVMVESMRHIEGGLKSIEARLSADAVKG